MPRTIALVASLVAFALIAGAAYVELRAQPEPEPAVRTTEAEDGSRVELQTPARTLVKGDTRLTLVGVTHIGAPGYYDKLQTLLGAHDLVLYERVEPAWAQQRDDAPPEWNAAATRARIRHTAARVAIAARQDGEPVTDLDRLDEIVPPDDPLDRTAETDAWGRPLEVVRTGDGFDVISHGADGAPGGEGLAADLRLSDQPELTDAEIRRSGGLQADLARAAGLAFQLDAIDYNKPGFVNADVSAERLMAALAGRDVGPDAIGAIDNIEPQESGLLAMLSGDSPLASIIGGVLRFAGMLPGGQQTIRLVLIETLARSDAFLEDAGPALGPQVDRMMTVLLDLRNDAVLERLRDALNADNPPRRVALFYGAGHLPGIERTLLNEGWNRDGTEWLTAMRVEASPAFSASQIRSIRNMIAGSLEQQMRMLDNQNAPQNKR